MTRLKDVAVINRRVMPENTPADYEFEYLDISAVDNLGKIAALEIAQFGSAPSRARRLVALGDTVMSTVRTYLRSIAFIDEAFTGVVASTGFATISPLAEIWPRYLYWLLRSDDFVGQVVANSVGVSYPAVTPTQLGRLQLEVPNMTAQVAVAEYLDAETARIEQLIAEQQTLVSHLTERRAAELDGWIEHGGNESVLRAVDSPWLDAVPRTWGVMPLKHAVQRVMVGIVITPSAYYEDEGVPVLRGLNVRPGRVTANDLVYMSDHSNLLHAKSVLREGDVVVVRTGLAGAAAQVPSWAVGGNAVDLLIVRPGRDMLPAYVELLLNSRLVQRQVVYGSVGALQAHFNTSSLSNVSVTVPPLEEQRRVVDHLGAALERYDRLMTEAQGQVALLGERRQALITHAVTHGIEGLPGVA